MLACLLLYCVAAVIVRDKTTHQRKPAHQPAFHNAFRWEQTPRRAPLPNGRETTTTERKRKKVNVVRPIAVTVRCCFLIYKAAV